jgi:hypothetical protein
LVLAVLIFVVAFFPLFLQAQLSEFRQVIKEKYPSRGSQTTPAHSNRDFTFIDYCPNVFRRIRQIFKIDAADYLLSLTAEYQLSEIISPGKSKSFFYFSWDMKYMLKVKMFLFFCLFIFINLSSFFLCRLSILLKQSF